MSILDKAKSAQQRISAWSRELAQVRDAVRLSDPYVEGTPIFFIVGYPKSGTTWLTITLNSHPEILCQGEGRFFAKDWKQDRLKKKQVSYPPISLYNALLSSEDLRYWIARSVWSKHDDIGKHLDNLMRLAIEYFLILSLVKSGKRLVGDKTVLLNPDVVREIGTICPRTKVIHIIRDGRDVAVSTMHHRWNQAEDQGGHIELPPDQLAKRNAYRKDPKNVLKTEEGIFPNGWLESNATKWSTRVNKAVEDGLALFGTAYREVRYEELVETPEEAVKRLLEFLGVDASAQTVKRCVSVASFEKLAGDRRRGQEAPSFFRKGIAGDWKNVFTEQNKRDFKAAAGDMLIKLGYEEDNYW